MSDNKQFAKFIRLLSFDAERNVETNMGFLKNLLHRDDVKNSKIIPLLFVESFNTGGNNVLDSCLKYLYANVSMKIEIFIL